MTPAAIQSILDSPEVREWGQVRVDGFIGPSHVSAVIGSRPYEYFADEYQRPVVIAGFEPLDVLQAIRMLVRQLNEAAPASRINSRAASRARAMPRRSVWSPRCSSCARASSGADSGSYPTVGCGSSLTYGKFDAERRFDIKTQAAPENAACQCPAIIRGVKKPTDCALFGSACTPRNPIGSCMVSAEGACAAYYKYRRGTLQTVA